MRGILNKRPIAFCAFFVACGIAVSYYTHLYEDMPLLIIALVCLALFFILLFLKRKQAFLLLYVFAFFIGGVLFSQDYNTDFSEVDFSKTYTVSARVSNREKITQKTRTYTLGDVTLLDGDERINFPKDVILYSTDLLEYGDLIEFDTKIEQPKTPRNPGTFDQKMYLASKNAGFSCYAYDVQYKGNVGGIYGIPLLIRETLSEKIDEMYTEDTAPIAKAMLLGVRDEIPEETREEFSNTGIAHILAISGLHIGILIMALDFLMKKLKASRKTRFLTEIILLLFYAFITAFAPSVVRAVLMGIMVILGRWFFKKRDTLTFLAVAMLVLLCYSSAQLFLPGFLLSFGIVFGILCLLPLTSRFYEKRNIKNSFTDMLNLSLIASVVCIPIVAYYFDTVVYIAPVANFFAIPLASFIVVFTGISSVLALITLPLGGIFAFLSSLCITALVYCNKALASTGFGFLSLEEFPIWAGILIFCIFFICSDYLFIKKKLKMAISIALCVVITAGVSASYVLKNDYRAVITILDVGTGDAVHVSTKEGDILIDNGGNMQRSNLAAYSKDNDIVYDFVLITNDRTNNLGELIGEERIGALYVPPGYIAKAWDEALPMQMYALYDTIDIGGGAKISIVAGDGKNYSVVINVDRSDVCLLAQNAAEALTDVNTDVPVIKLAKGGAEGSVDAAMLAGSTMEYAIASVKEYNEAGLPDVGVKELIGEKDAELLSTGARGAVIITVGDEGQIKIDTML